MPSEISRFFDVFKRFFGFFTMLFIPFLGKMTQCQKNTPILCHYDTAYTILIYIKKINMIKLR